MRRVFEVTKQLISAPEYRDLLRDVAQLLTSWLQHMANASVHVAAGKQAAAKKEGKQAKHDREQVQKQMQTMQDHFKSIAKRLQDHPAWRESVSDILALFGSFRAHVTELIAEKTKQQQQGGTTATEGSATASKSETEGAAGIGLLLPEDDEARKHAELALGKAKQLVANFGGNLEPVQTAARRLIDALAVKVPEVDELLDGLQKLALEPTNQKLASDLYRRAQDLVKEEGKPTDKAVHGGGDIGGVVTRQQQMRQQQQQKVQQQQEQQQLQPQQFMATEEGKTGPIRNALMELADAGTTFVKSLRRDEHLQEAQQSLSALMSELFIDKSTGQAKLKPELGVDVQKLVPALVQSLTALPVARINVATDEMDTIIDNVSLAATVLPKDINVVTETHMSVDSGNMTSTILISLRSVQMEVPNVVFWYNKKSFPTLADVGIADVNIGGRGLDLDLKLLPSRDPNQLLKVISSEAHIHELSLNIKRARHNWMYAIFSPIVERTVAGKLEEAVATAMTRVIENFDQTMGQTVQKTSAQLSSMSAPQLPELSSITSAIGSGATATTGTAGTGQDVIQPIKSTIGKVVEAATGFVREAMQTEE
ncbi:hypothetical protein BC828DRAFT_387539 [Blastocladiella britannica]|nr:hypothetical protein BC828DRAFT_387539 [Blastocladiella britannica]